MEKYGYAVDIGGTAIKFGLFSEDGRLLEKREFITDCSDGGRNILPDVAAAVHDSMSRLGIDEGDILGIGIDVPGPATEDGLVRKCVNLGWNAVIDVGGELEQLIKLPVFVGNDGDTAALGEMWQGSAKGCRNLVLITLGTGVGGGIVVDGKIVCGKNGAGGEIGHIPLNPDEPLACPCGNRGCLEQYASATGVVRKARELLAADMRVSELRSFERLTAKDVWECCAHGDALATSVIENFGDYLGRGAAAIACVVDPEVIVLGGGMAKAGEPVLKVTEKYYRKYAFHASKDCPFKLALLGNDAGIYGGMYRVLESKKTGIT